MKINRILAAIDESDFTQKIIDAAHSLAKTSNAQLGLITVVDPTPMVMSADNVVYPPEMMGDMIKGAEDMLEKTKQDLGSDVPILVFCKTGNPRHEIVECAHDWDADLIVIGTHGRTGIMHVVMGSVAENVIRHSTIPVMVIPAKVED